MRIDDASPSPSLIGESEQNVKRACHSLNEARDTIDEMRVAWSERGYIETLGRFTERHARLILLTTIG